MRTAAARLMVLVDGENFPAKHADEMTARASELGSVVEVRVYGHYGELTMSSWKAVSAERGFTRVDVAVEGPNSSDFRLTIEAVDMLHTRNADAYLVASSDSGFSALAERIRASATRAYGIGERKAKPEYRRHFDEFFETKTARKPAAPKPTPTTATPKTTSAAPAKAPLPMDAMLAVIKKLKGPDGWTHLAEFGKHYRPKAHGYASITKLVGDGLKDYVAINPDDPRKIRVRPI